MAVTESAEGAEPYDPSVSAARELVDYSVAALICLAIVAATVWRRWAVRASVS